MDSDEIKDDDKDDAVFENDPRFIQIIEERRASYGKNGGISLDEASRQLGLTNQD